MLGVTRNAETFWVENLNGRGNLKDKDADGRIKK
jgi:hypothetical protein